MKTIGLLVNLKKPQAEEVVRKLTSLLSGMGFTVFTDAETARMSPVFKACEPTNFATAGAEGVIVLGGDGTMLDAAHRLSGGNLPMLGLNMGSLGYLTSVEEQQFGEALKALRENRLTVSRRTTLAVRICRAGGTVDAFSDALNEVVVDHGTRAHAVELTLALNGKTAAEFLCDGIIVATPTGSTAYSLSAGGPIVLPDMRAFVVNVICPHTLTFRPLVVRDDTRLSIRLSENAACTTPVMVNADGRDTAPLGPGDRVEIGRSTREVTLIELEGYDAYDVLRRKLRWGRPLRNA